MEVTKILNGNEYVAVVYAPGFGAGWSTWGAANATDGRIVNWLLEHYNYYIPTDKDAVEEGSIIRCGRYEGEVNEEEVKKLEKFCIEQCGYSSNQYYRGGRELDIAWVKRGTRYHIEEYDGRETVREIDDSFWYTA